VPNVTRGLAVLLALGAPVTAQTTHTWNYSSTDWAASSSWSPAGPPPTDTAVLGAFDGPTLNLPAFSAPAAAGQLRILGPRGLTSGTVAGNGNTLTLGTGGVMADPALAFRGTFGARVTLDHLRVSIAPGTAYTPGTYADTVGATDVSGFASQVILQNGSELRLVDALGTTNSNLTISDSAVVLNAGTWITNGLGMNANPQGAIRFQGGGQLSTSRRPAGWSRGTARM
jgi:hypothetical protein